MIEIIILAVVTFFIYKKLFAALGDTSHDREISPEEKSRVEEFKKSLIDIIEAKQQQERQIEIASGLEASLTDKDREVFDAIRLSDANFNAEKFTKGASAAFAMIIKAYAQGDRDVLKQLLDKNLYESFAITLDEQDKLEQIQEVTLVKVSHCEILSAELAQNNKAARIATKFISEQIKVTKDKISGNIISGSPNKVIEINEIWTFEKNLLSKDNLWKLIAVSSDDED